MPRFLIDTTFRGECRITAQDAKHISKVLRLGPGDQLTLTDGNGKDFMAVIQTVSPSQVCCKIIQEQETVSESPLKITLCQGMLKDKKMESLLRHVTELGIYEWRPFFCERSVPLPDTKRMGLRVQRWESIAKESLKQCERSRVPLIHPPGTFNDMLILSQSMDLKIILWEALKSDKKFWESIKDNCTGITSVMILTGPEGGFSKTEVEAAQKYHFTACGLGPRILRAQTASIAVCTLIQSVFGDM